MDKRWIDVLSRTYRRQQLSRCLQTRCEGMGGLVKYLVRQRIVQTVVVLICFILCL